MLDDYYYQHLIPRNLENREVFLSASNDIENSFTGRLDVMSLHIFFAEASTLLKNSIRQYEEGFFDSAFYSIRSALEIARIIAYFSSQEQPTDSDVYKKWTSGGKFPYDNQVKTLLQNTSGVYGEVRDALSVFFDSQDERLKKVQKYIHKQGYRTFYTQRSFKQEEREFVFHTTNKLYVEFLSSSITEIAILRLCVDPFPVLLRDEDVMYKIHFQSVTEPYSDRTMDLIGDDLIAKYKTTEFYKSHLDNFSSNEKLEEATYSLINDEYYDRNDWPTIEKQFHLLSFYEQTAVRLFNVYDEITKVYFQGGWSWYFSNVESLRTKTGFDSRVLDTLKNSPLKSNADYDGVFLSYFVTNDNEDVWLEHNKKLSKEHIEMVEKALSNTPNN